MSVEVTTPNPEAAATGTPPEVHAEEASAVESIGGSADGSAEDGDDSGSEEGSEAAAAGADGPAKKKRKRRRKKKDGEAPAAAGGEAQPAPHKPKPNQERAPFNLGEEVFGRVTAVLPEAIMVDLSGKALGIFDRAEMEKDDLVPTEGDRFLARVHQDGGRGGLVVLTRKPLREEAIKGDVERALRDGLTVQGLITGVIKGGVDVDIAGLRAFAPASGMDLHPQNANFASLVGQRLDFKVTQFGNNGRDVVVTRRPMLEAEAHERRKRALEILSEGQVMQGVVRTVVEWGAFVALPEAENLEGLVHQTEASHDARARMSDLFRNGDRIEVKIVKIDERGKIWLSRRALIADPWREAKDKYPAGTQLKVAVTKVEPFGAFVQLDGIEGLIHSSDMDLDKGQKPADLFKAGDEVDVVVFNFDLKNHKIVLHPAPSGNAAGEERQKVTRNASVKVEVKKAEPAGLVVRILGVTGRGARGFIPAGQTGTARGSDLRKHFPAGQQFMAQVVDIDPRRGEPKLSISRFHEDEERSAHREYRKKLAAEANFGTLGDLLRKSLSK
jgi:small subunit ribosomal protein S1